MISLKELKSRAEINFIRSGGPGGQNVNKRSTKARLRIEVESLPISSNEKKRIFSKLKNRINKEGEIIVKNEESRSQKKNKERVIEEALDVINNALRKRKKRKKTSPPKSANEKRLKNKKEIGRKKQERSQKTHDFLKNA